MIVSVAQAPVHETPNAVMRTLAAPSLGAQELSVWEVTMDAGASGPPHAADHEQVWVVLDGELSIEATGTRHTVRGGEAITLAGHIERRVHAHAATRVLVSSRAAPSVTTAEQGPRALPWAQ